MGGYGRWLFGAAAAFNGAVGLALLAARPVLSPLIGLDPAAGSNLALLLVAGFILIFAYAYLRIALDPVRFRPLIHIGAIGKLMAFASVVFAWAIGQIDVRLPALAAGDAAFAMLFFDYLRRTAQPRAG